MSTLFLQESSVSETTWVSKIKMVLKKQFKIDYYMVSITWLTLHLRLVSTQENKHRIGLDFFPSFLSTPPDPNKVENTSTLDHPGCGSVVQTGTENCYRKPLRGFNFVPIQSDLSHAYFPERKSAFILFALHCFRMTCQVNTDYIV